MGAKAVASALGRQPPWGWAFIVDNCLVTTSIDGDLLQGLLIENTPYQKPVYVWAVSLPMFHLAGTPALNFSVRLDRGRYFKGETDIIVQDICNVIDADRHLANRLTSSLTANDFLKVHPLDVQHHERRPAIIAFDVAAIVALAGNTSGAIRIFINLAERKQGYPAGDRIRAMTLACLDRLNAGKSIQPVLDHVAAENKARWRIVPVKRPKPPSSRIAASKNRQAK